MKTKSSFRLFCLCSLLVFSLLFSGCGLGKIAREHQQAQGGPVELKLAYHLPANHYLSQGMERFAQRVNERSGGSIKVTTYPAGQLYTDKSMNDAIMTGGLDMGLNSTAMWTTVVPALNVLDVPFLLNSYEAVGRAMNGSLGRTLTTEMERKGVHPLIWVDYGYVQFCNNQRPLTKPEDFRGLQLRGYGQIPAETIKALGASPVTMSSGEVYMAIQRGTIDGQTSGTTAMYQRKIYEVAKYLTMTNHAFCEFVLAMNNTSWEQLTEEQKQLVTQCAEETRDEIRQQTKEEDLKAMQKLKDSGMEVYTIPAEDIPLWQDATLEVRENFIRNTGDLGRQLVDQCLSAN
ncbi:MAG: DctP family TRAP transporter solute-binding subunit [Selenomonas sp.]|nr:DctP family TRAP transporter solute-binding subunit [Selenomonadales bacterium]MDD7762754.1 DctP family TRAP transporter solute-binding subunit [Selenomonadales bacterium]MDY5717574.1 DctP family TRAP transporter solute-binding subunit [Selenomonas sp.]